MKASYYIRPCRHQIYLGLPTGRVCVISRFKEGGSSGERAYFQGSHDVPVTALKVISSKDGSDGLLCSGSIIGDIRIWECKSMRCLRKLDGGVRPSEIRAIAPDLDNHRVCASMSDGSVCIWSYEGLFDFTQGVEQATLKPVHVLRPLVPTPLPIKRMIYSAELNLVALPSGRELHLYDISTHALLAVLRWKSAPSGIPPISDELSTMNWDIESSLLTTVSGNTKSERVFIILVGDKAGRVALWNVNDALDAIERRRQSPDDESLLVIIAPERQWQAHTGEVTCIDLDAFKITTAGVDGYIR
jgi:WD40 repeat protein